MGAGSVLGLQNGAKLTNIDQDGVKRISKGNQKDTKREPKAAKTEPKATKVSQKAMPQNNKNDVQKQSVPGHPTPLGAIGPDCLSFFYIYVQQ